MSAAVPVLPAYPAGREAAPRVSAESQLSHLPRIDCDECSAPADHVHFLPWVVDCERVEFTCPNHDAGGYGFALERLWSSAAEHIAESKRGGYRALAVLFERLETFAHREEGT